MKCSIDIDSTSESQPYSFEADKIFSLQTDQQLSLVGEELFIDQLDAEVLFDGISGTGELTLVPSDYDGFESSDGYVLTVYDHYVKDLLIPYGTKLKLMYGDPAQEHIGTFYVNEVKRVGANKFRINAVSAIGLMDKMDSPGGLYLSGSTFSQVLAEIIGAPGERYNYVIDDYVADLPQYGWLPYDKQRENLYQLIFANNVSIVTDLNGQLNFVFVVASENPPTIPDGRIYVGGGIEKAGNAAAFIVAEHRYITNLDREVVFDNTGDAALTDWQIIIFDKPVVYNVPPQTTGTIEIDEWTANYAIIRGNGSISSQVYRDVVSLIHDGDAQNENTISVTDATMVNSFNSAGVLERLKAYYTQAKIIKNTIVREDERCGYEAAFNNPFMEPAQGIIKHMTSNYSGIVKAECEWVAGYSPTGGGSAYQHREVLTGSDVWFVPAGVERVRAVLIGSGAGGMAGANGEAGGTGQIWAAGKPGQGGAGGNGGSGGKVYVVDIQTEPHAMFRYAAGQGGVGGTQSTFPGDSTDTTLTVGDATYSSASGVASENGYFDALGGMTYALRGTDGAPGMYGGAGGVVDARNEDPTPQSIVGSMPGESFGSLWAGGASALHYYDYWYEPTESGDAYVGVCKGGCGGGGAAYGNNGGNAYKTSSKFGVNRGGAGADAVAPDAQTTLGSGGRGGNGGGGGGAGGNGAAWAYAGSGLAPVLDEPGIGGAGGAGSNGTQGGAGCVIIYW